MQDESIQPIRPNLFRIGENRLISENDSHL